MDWCSFILLGLDSSATLPSDSGTINFFNQNFFIQIVTLDLDSSLSSLILYNQQIFQTIQKCFGLRITELLMLECVQNNFQIES